MARDDFNNKTKDILAKRVGFLCSNPKCRKHTIGPNSNPNKATLVGEAAHITAASKKSPRFDENLDPLERKNVSNGIWLCSNCSDLIDKDEEMFTVTLLLEWKNAAENEMLQKIGGNYLPELKPNLDIDLIWHLGGRSPNGYSPKNKYEYLENDDAYILRTNPPIIFWKVFWNFKLVIFNNSSIPLLNLKIEQEEDFRFDFLSQLPRVNNLPSLQNIDLEAKSSMQIESTYLEADKILQEKTPTHLEGLKLTFNYEDERGKEYSDIFQIQDSEFVKL